ncbi:MAG: hypothetical protein ABSE63_08445, partial [Thermoguttaceae bacterium]
EKLFKRARSVPSKWPCRQDEQTGQYDKLGKLTSKPQPIGEIVDTIPIMANRDAFSKKLW